MISQKDNVKQAMKFTNHLVSAFNYGFREGSY